jgi:hypothetical protein
MGRQGGGRKAANYVFRSSRPDGLTIGNAGSSMVQLEILGESGVLVIFNPRPFLTRKTFPVLFQVRIQNLSDCLF